MKPVISFVIPMFNEEKTFEQIITKVSKQIENTKFDYEIICVNDGSIDNTAQLLEKAAANDNRIIPVHLSKNFGKEGAMAAGLDSVKGSAAIIMDSDLQHPPEIIPKMIKKWEEGYDIVEGRKADRGKESLLYRLFAGIFYSIMGRAANLDLAGSSDFQLLDIQVVKAICDLPEKLRFFRGLVAWVGFKRTSIEFEVQKRAGGESTWSILKLSKYAINNILSFTAIPLYITAWLGIITIIIGIVMGVQTFYNYLGGKAVSGFTTVILLIIFFSGIIMASIGTVAVYLAKVFKEVKSRPYYIVRKKRDK